MMRDNQMILQFSKWFVKGARATARVPAPHPLLSRPYYDYARKCPVFVIIVGAGVDEG